MKKTLIILAVVGLFSCKNQDEKKFYYPSEQDYANIENPVKLNLDNFSNYEELIDSIEILMADQRNVISYIIQNNNFYFFKINSLEEKGGTTPYHIKLRNLLGISTDSLLKNDYYSIDSLESFLKKDLLNYGKDNNFSDNPNKFIVSFELDENERILELNKLLIKVFETYNQLKGVDKDTIPLNIYFNWKHVFPKPPPMPTEVNNNE